MMQDADIVVAIDVGTSKVCTIVARRENNRGFRMLSHSVVPSEGIEKGNVTDVAATRSAIAASVAEAAQKAGVTVKDAYVGVTGSHISYENRHDQLRWATTRGVITTGELSQVPDTVAASSRQDGRRVLHALPRNYMLDGQRGIRNPLGMHTSRLEVESHVIMGADDLVEKLTLAVEQAGLNVVSLVLEPIASAQAVLTEEEKEQGVALVDLGGGTTDLVVYSQGTVFYNAALPVGGFQFTNDICVAYSTTYEAAEEAKLKIGNTEPSAVKANEELSLPIEGRTRHRQITAREICQLMRERAQELVRLVRIKLHEAGQNENSGLRLVLTGGASGLPGLDDMMRRSISRHVRIGVPNGVSDMPDELRSPKYATSVGILLWAMKAPGATQPTIVKNGVKSEASLNGGMSKIFKKWLPR